MQVYLLTTVKIPTLPTLFHYQIIWKWHWSINAAITCFLYATYVINLKINKWLYFLVSQKRFYCISFKNTRESQAWHLQTLSILSSNQKKLYHPGSIMDYLPTPYRTIIYAKGIYTIHVALPFKRTYSAGGPQPTHGGRKAEVFPLCLIQHW